MRDKIFIQDEFDTAISESNTNIISVSIPIEKYYTCYGGIFSLLREDINILCVKHDLCLFRANELFDQINNLKDKSYLAVTAISKAKQENIEKEEVKKYVTDYVNDQYYKTSIKINFKRN